MYGEAFQCLRGAWKEGDDLFAEIALGETEIEEARSYGIHPALFDAALHPALLGDIAELRLPFSWESVRLYAAGAERKEASPSTRSTSMASPSSPSGR
jgi:hypothetical protein